MGFSGKCTMAEMSSDFSTVFLSGDSSGANIAHIIMMRASIDEDHKLEVGDNLNLVGMALTHPFSETMNQIEFGRIFALKIPILMTVDAIQ
ncbi:probable carboxylesterase 12 [Solanum pennellii]|uniref:Probable carboxylesterase 12 n=1 Tax=Solanum pennellii TaxID=28526 RepID=A0ABM1GTZ9_SOLPN|nr:probable carboxylesterase 12 [Solanum pennellii]